MLDSFRLHPLSKKGTDSLAGSIISYLALALILGYGAYLRIGDQASRDFYVDEIWRAKEIVQNSSFGEVDLQLQLSEFVLGKVGLWIFGKNELAFRISSIVFSLLSLLLFSRIALHLFGAFAATVAAFLMATNYGMVEHAYEFKPYCLETFVVLLCAALLIRIDCAAPSRETLKSYLPLALLVGIIGIVSLNIFPFVSFLLPLIWVRTREFSKSATQVWSRIGLLSSPILAAGLAYAFLYPRYVQQLMTNKVFDFWTQLYLSADNFQYLVMFQLPRTLSWYVISTIDLLSHHYLWAVCLGAAILISIPLWLFRQRNTLCFFLWWPALIMIFLSSLEVYPLLSRVSAFWYPFLILVLCVPLNELFESESISLPASFKRLAYFTVTILIAGYIVRTPRSDNAGTHQHIWELKPLFRTLEQRSEPGDILYLNFFTKLALEFYDLEAIKSLRIEGLAFHTSGMTTDAEKQKYISVFLDDVVGKHENKTVWLFGAYNVDAAAFYEKGIRGHNLQLLVADTRPGCYLIGFRTVYER